MSPFDLHRYRAKYRWQTTMVMRKVRRPRVVVVSGADVRSVARAFTSKTLRGIFLRAARQGWRWRMGGDHVVLYPPTGGRPMILSTTAYDGPIMKAMKTRFKRAGLLDEKEGPK